MTQTMSHSSRALAAANAWDRHLRIVGLKRGIENDFIELGQELSEFHSREEWRLLGHESFNAYLADPDVNIGRRMAFILMKVYRHYRLELRCETVALLGAGVSKLNLMIPATTFDNVDEWLARAGALSRSDLREELGCPARPGDDEARREVAQLRHVVGRAAKVVREKGYAEPEFDALLAAAAGPVGDGERPSTQLRCPRCGHVWSDND